MRTRSSSHLIAESSTTPKRRNRRRSKQRVEPFSLEETPVVTMADQRTMAELLRAPTEGYAEAIVVPPIPAEHFELKHSLINFELKHSLINLVTSKQFFSFEKEDPHAIKQKVLSTLISSKCTCRFASAKHFFNFETHQVRYSIIETILINRLWDRSFQ
ncbi:hypothetical protein Tco_0613197 [Tanacetum coccineum]